MGLLGWELDEVQFPYSTCTASTVQSTANPKPVHSSLLALHLLEVEAVRFFPPTKRASVRHYLPAMARAHALVDFSNWFEAGCAEHTWEAYATCTPELAEA
eukprot:5553414-Amphidinium_carterae.1